MEYCLHVLLWEVESKILCEDIDNFNNDHMQELIDDGYVYSYEVKHSKMYAATRKGYKFIQDNGDPFWN